jgi:hypothetical protein
MKKTVIMYGSTTGNTRSAADSIAAQLGTAEIRSVDRLFADEVASYDFISRLFMCKKMLMGMMELFIGADEESERRTAVKKEAPVDPDIIGMLETIEKTFLPIRIKE